VTGAARRKGMPQPRSWGTDAGKLGMGKSGNVSLEGGKSEGEKVTLTSLGIQFSEKRWKGEGLEWKKATRHAELQDRTSARGGEKIGVHRDLISSLGEKKEFFRACQENKKREGLKGRSPSKRGRRCPRNVIFREARNNTIQHRRMQGGRQGRKKSLEKKWCAQVGSTGHHETGESSKLTRGLRTRNPRPHRLNTYCGDRGGDPQSLKK